MFQFSQVIKRKKSHKEEKIENRKRKGKYREQEIRPRVVIKYTYS